MFFVVVAVVSIIVFSVPLFAVPVPVHVVAVGAYTTTVVICFSYILRVIHKGFPYRRFFFTFGAPVGLHQSAMIALYARKRTIQ